MDDSVEISGVRKRLGRRPLAVRLRSSVDYRYVTPSTVRDKSTGDTGSAHRNAAHISDLRRYDRHPNVTATRPRTIDTAATTNTQVLMLRVAIATEIPASHRMWPTTNPPIPATQIALKS